MAFVLSHFKLIYKEITYDFTKFWPDCKAISAYELMMSNCLSICRPHLVNLYI